MTKTIKTPVVNHIFKVDDAYVKLCETEKIILHQLVEKILFLSNHAQPDMQPKITLITTIVRNPDEDNWKKLRRVLSYIYATINSVKLHLNVNDLNVVHWWVGALYGTHPYLKGQTGAMISIGKGCVTSVSKKQKVNATISTISELVGVHEASPQVLWTNALLQNQCFEVNKATLYQDNMSAMLLETNGRASRSSRTKDIEIIYFFIQDRIERGDIQLEYFHTNKMVADLITKLLQGKISLSSETASW